MSDPAAEKTHRCGDSGGRTSTGQPCRFRVKEKGARCSRHDPRWAGPDPEPKGPEDEVKKPTGPWWHKAVSAAYLRLTTLTIAESAAGAGVGERTLKRWEGCSWWAEALQEAETRWLNHVVARAQRTVFKASGEDVGTAMKILERRIARLAPPKQRVESTNYDIDPADLSEIELERIKAGEDPVFVLAQTRGVQTSEEGAE